MVVANLVVKSLVILQSVVMRLISFCFSLLTAILFITSYIWPAYLRTLIFMTIKNEWYVLPASSSYPMVAVYPVCKYWWKGIYRNAIVQSTTSDWFFLLIPISIAEVPCGYHWQNIHFKFQKAKLEHHIVSPTLGTLAAKSYNLALCFVLVALQSMTC